MVFDTANIRFFSDIAKKIVEIIRYFVVLKYFAIFNAPNSGMFLHFLVDFLRNLTLFPTTFGYFSHFFPRLFAESYTFSLRLFVKQYSKVAKPPFPKRLFRILYVRYTYIFADICKKIFALLEFTCYLWASKTHQ